MIRPAEPRDSAAIRAVHRAAFLTDAEADLIDRLGSDTAVSLVAERGGEVAGHLVLSRMQVTGDGRPYRALGLGPVGVLPEYQRSGIGSDLMHGALAIAKATREELVFVLGEPEYYARFGFTAETAAPFASPYAGPFLMALKLREEVELPTSGTAQYAKAFEAL